MKPKKSLARRWRDWWLVAAVYDDEISDHLRRDLGLPGKKRIRTPGHPF